MFITAAITGAVMQDADPLQSKFIPHDYLENFVSDTERNTLWEALTSDGWKPVAKDGLRIRLKTQGIIDEDSLSSLSPEENGKAQNWLAENKWQKEENIWHEPDSELTNIPTITTAMLETIESTDIQKKVVMELTSQGWQADGEGNLSWHYAQGESYLPPELLTQNFITALQTSGWENCGIGYKKEYNTTSPYLPIFPQDIIHNAHESAREGAAIVHLHTRDLRSKEGGYTIPGLPVNSRNIIGNNIIDTEQYEKITPALLDNDPALVLNFSTSMRGNPLEPAQRREHLTGYGTRNLPPDIASFSPGDVIFQAGGCYANSPDFIVTQAAHIKEKGIRPEVEVFNRTIANNACDTYQATIRDLGTPPLFMLVPVDQYRTKPTKENSSPADDSLIPVAVRKQITQYIKEGNLAEAKSLAVKHLKPVVEQIKSAHPDAIISLLMPGAMQSIITDVAVELRLDGIRVGLEDSLNITDEHIAGGMRKATNAEQVQRVREELAAKGIPIETAEQLRTRLGMDREEVKLFREMEELLAPLAECLPNRSQLPPASEILEILAPLKERYMQMEARFTQDVLSLVNAKQTPEKMAEIIWDTARKHRMGIRFFMEEAERYENPKAFSLRDVHTLQPLNFMREVLYEQGQDTSLFDVALENFQATGKSKIIPVSQFKDSDTRFLDFAAFIPVIYNQDRTAITNTGLREDKHYSATMAILLTALEEKMLALREKADVPAKESTILWQKLQAPLEKSRSQPNRCDFITVPSEELSDTLSASSWIVLPSTPATHYPSGIASSNGLAQTLRGFIHNAIEAYQDNSGRIKHSPDVISCTHAGTDSNGKTVIEAGMQANRFALNTDSQGVFSTFSVEQIYDQLILPRLVQKGTELDYQANGKVKRNEQGIPLDKNGDTVQRINATAIADLPLLKLIGHSSGVATAQQMDNLQRNDMTNLGYSTEEQQALFRKSVLVHFGSATNISLAHSGTPTLDITAATDIRSIAGTDLASSTTPSVQDYTALTPEIKREVEETLSRQRKVKNKHITIKNPEPVITTAVGEEDKPLIRVTLPCMSDDPRRKQDGHSIINYTREAPEIVKALMAVIDKQQAIGDVETMLNEASDLVKNQQKSRAA